MVEIIWNNGQGEFDFDYLLKITNQEFVDRITSSIDISDIRLKSVKVVDAEHVVSVTVVGTSAVTHFDFWKSSGTIDRVVLGISDLRWMLNVMEGSDNE